MLIYLVESRTTIVEWWIDNDKKVCDIQKHYELLIIEFHLVSSINKKTIVKQEDVVLIFRQKEKKRELDRDKRRRRLD